MTDNMAAPERTFISYFDQRLRLNCDNALAADVRQSLEPFFEFSDDTSGTEPFIDVIAHPEEMDGKPEVSGEKIAVDSSLYKQLSSDGEMWKNGQRWTTRIVATDTWFRFDRSQRKVDVFQIDPERRLTDVVRLIKGLFTPALEIAGAIQLHSAGVVADDQVVLILGDMWQGKTTLLLELMGKFNVKQLSCDTVVVRPVGTDGIQARGWPSPFSMSHGTMCDHEALQKFIPKERRALDYNTLWKERKKTVLTSQQIV